MLHQRKMIERNICSEPIRPSTTLWEDLKSSLIMLIPGTTLIPIEDLGMWGRKHLWLKQLLPSSRSYHTAKHPNAKDCNQHNSRSITENKHDCHCHSLQLQPIFQLISTSILKGQHPVPSHRQHVHCARNIETDLGWQFQKQFMDYGGFISANCKQRNMHSKCNIANKRNMHTIALQRNMYRLDYIAAISKHKQVHQGKWCQAPNKHQVQEPWHNVHVHTDRRRRWAWSWWWWCKCISIGLLRNRVQGMVMHWISNEWRRITMAMRKLRNPASRLRLRAVHRRSRNKAADPSQKSKVNHHIRCMSTHARKCIIMSKALKCMFSNCSSNSVFNKLFGFVSGQSNWWCTQLSLTWQLSNQTP